MRRRDRLLAKARNNPNGLRFGEFETLLSQCGWVFRRQTGSHRYWYSPQRYRLSIQLNGGKAKGYQVRQFLKRYDEEDADGEG
jgi:predicted RNA binding protein YcfA (HicA-like mRNA interferase family)